MLRAGARRRAGTDLPDPPNPFIPAATRIVAVIEGDVGPSGEGALAESGTDGLLMRADDALDEAIRACGRHVIARRKQRYMTWLVRDILGVQKEVKGEFAEETGARLLQHAGRVRTADGKRVPGAARDAALAKTYPREGGLAWPWEEQATSAAAARAQGEQATSSAAARVPVPELDLANFISDFRAHSNLFSPPMLAMLKDYFRVKRGNEDGPKPWADWQQYLLADAAFMLQDQRALICDLKEAAEASRDLVSAKDTLLRARDAQVRALQAEGERLRGQVEAHRWLIEKYIRPAMDHLAELGDPRTGNRT